MTDATRKRLSPGSWALREGAIAGILGGIVFAMAEMITAAIVKNDFWGPLKMIAAVPLGERPPALDVGAAIVTGGLTHMTYSIGVAILVAAIVAYTPISRSKVATLLFASLVGLAIWPINFYWLMPALDAPWFAQQTSAWRQFLWHTFAFGSVVGIWLAARLSKLSRTASASESTPEAAPSPA